MVTVWAKKAVLKGSALDAIKMTCSCGTWTDQLYDNDKIPSVAAAHINSRHEGEGDFIFNQELRLVRAGLVIPSNRPQQMQLGGM